MLLCLLGVLMVGIGVYFGPLVKQPNNIFTSAVTGLITGFGITAIAISIFG
jgi:hypothetical protein